MTKFKGREHAGELMDAMCWCRDINDRMCDIGGFSGCYLVGVEFVPKDDRDDFSIKFMEEMIFQSCRTEYFNSEEVEVELLHELDSVVKNLAKLRRVLKAIRQSMQKKKAT